MALPVRQIFIVARPFMYENRTEVEAALNAIADRAGIAGVRRFIGKRPSANEIPAGSVLVFDNASRIADDTYGLISILSQLLNKGVGILGPEQIRVMPGEPGGEQRSELIKFLFAQQALFRSVRIREGLFLSRLRGNPLGRKSITDEVKQRILDEHEAGASIRAISKRLKAEGISVSKSKAHQVVMAGRKK